MIILLENLRSSFNVGSIFRSADAFGVEKILLVGTTPTPIDRIKRENKGLTKVSLGAENNVLWEYYKNTNEALKSYDEYEKIVVEQTHNAVNFMDVNINKAIYIFGNEVDGVSEETIKNNKKQVFIPMIGKKESLNVSITASIIMHQIACSSLDV